MAKNINAIKRGFHWDPIAEDLGIYVNGIQVESYTDAVARNYYVNNITGSSSNNGRSWGSAFDEPSAAIAAVIAYQATMDSGDEYIRNNIIIQGTSTAYAALTSLAGYTNYIGIGADPSGNGGGIARIDGKGVADAVDTSATTVRGVNLYNLQLMQSVDGAVYGLDIAGAMYRARIEHCGFANNGTAGIHAKSCGSLVIDDCKVVMDQFWTDYGLLVGSTSASSGDFNACTISNSFFTGTTSGALIYNNSCGGTWINKCAFIGGTYGFRDLDNDANGEAHRLKITDCYGYGTNNNTKGQTGIVITNGETTKAMRCVDNAGGTLFQYPYMDMES